MKKSGHVCSDRCLIEAGCCRTCLNRYLKGVRHRAKARLIGFDLSGDIAWRILRDQSHTCVLSGLSIALSPTQQTASLDRIVPAQGYVNQNIRWLHKTINIMKWDIDDALFLRLCCLISRQDVRTLSPFEIDVRRTPPNFSGYGGVPSSFMAELKNNARRRSIKVNVAAPDVWAVYKKQHGRCVFSGLPVDFMLSNKSRCTASLDRIDSAGDYSIDNVQIVHNCVNRMKMSLSNGAFIEICTKIASRHLHVMDEAVKTRAATVLRYGVWYDPRALRPADGKYRGVSFDTVRKRWKASFTVNNKRYYLGRFCTAKEAAMNYDFHVTKMFGSGCYMNFPDGLPVDFRPKRLRSFQ